MQQIQLVGSLRFKVIRHYGPPIMIAIFKRENFNEKEPFWYILLSELLSERPPAQQDGFSSRRGRRSGQSHSPGGGGLAGRANKLPRPNFLVCSKLTTEAIRHSQD